MSLILTRPAQVGDFDLSRVVEPDATASNLTANNPRWLAPEVITSQVPCSHVTAVRASRGTTACVNVLSTAHRQLVFISTLW